MVPSVASEKIPSDTTGDRSRDPPQCLNHCVTPGSNNVRVLKLNDECIPDLTAGTEEYRLKISLDLKTALVQLCMCSMCYAVR
jgi:hypothetical protein